MLSICNHGSTLAAERLAAVELENLFAVFAVVPREVNFDWSLLLIRCVRRSLGHPLCSSRRRLSRAVARVKSAAFELSLIIVLVAIVASGVNHDGPLFLRELVVESMDSGGVDDMSCLVGVPEVHCRFLVHRRQCLKRKA